MTNTVKTKEFGIFRVSMVYRHPVGHRVYITNKKECDRVVVKLEAENAENCFDSVTSESIGLLESYLENNMKQRKHAFARAVKGYIYGTIDLVSEIEWFNPIAAAQSC